MAADLHQLGATLRAVENAADGLTAAGLFIAGCCHAHTQQDLDLILRFVRRLQESADAGKLTSAQVNLVEYSLMQGDIPQAQVRLDRFSTGDDVTSALRKSENGFRNLVEINGTQFLKNEATGEIALPEAATTFENTQKRISAEFERRENADLQRIRRQEEEDRVMSEALARQLQDQYEAEDKQIKADKVVKLDCQICYDSIKEEDYLPLEGCGHMFHPACIQDFLENEITERRFPLLCPMTNCKVEIREIDLQERLNPEMYQKYEEFCFKSYVERNNAEMSCCPTPDCKYVFIWTQEDPHFQCPACSKHYCLRCKCDWHKDLSCEENQKLTNPDELDKMFETMMKKTNFKQCPKCQFWVERAYGCDFIKCRCGFAFCYKCGNGFKDCKCGYGYCEKCGNDRIHCQCGYAQAQQAVNIWNPPQGFQPVQIVAAKPRRRRGNRKR